LEPSKLNPALLHEHTDEDHSQKAPADYTRGMQDPEHINQMLRSPLTPTHMACGRETEIDGLYRRKCWVKVLRSSLTPQDKVFSSGFQYKIKRKHGQSDKCKVRLVIQGQHMRLKDDTGVGYF
jgi:hypothetical protein